LLFDIEVPCVISREQRSFGRSAASTFHVVIRMIRRSVLVQEILEGGRRPGRDGLAGWR
jgi:hypothetical protein